MIMAYIGQPAQGWGNWQQGPGQVPSQQPFAQQGNSMQGGGGAGQAFRATDPNMGAMSGTGGGGMPPNMTGGGGVTMPNPTNYLTGGGGGMTPPSTYQQPGMGGGGMGDLMNLLMQHPAIQSMLQGMQRGGGPGNTGFPPTLGGMAGGAM